MRKKGFTLTELLAVIVILGIVAVIATVSVNRILGDSSDSLDKNKCETIRKAVITCSQQNIATYNNSCNSLDKLVNGDFLVAGDFSYLNPKYQINFANNKFTVTFNSDSLCK